jgi:hypothetical protein
MSQRNRQHVAIDPDYNTFWGFILPAEAETCSQEVEEFTSNCTNLFGTFNDFLVPIELQYYIRLYATDEQIPWESEAEPIDTIERTLIDNDGIDVDDFVTSTQVEREGAPWIPQIEFDRNKVRVRLETGDHLSDRTNRCTRYQHGEPLERESSWDPITISISHTPNRSYPDVDSEYIYQVGFYLQSDLWFEETEIGEKNRDYLSAFLERVENTLPVAKVVRDPERESDLQRIY